MLTTNERSILLAGAHNVRDLGGYPTRSGSSTLWRRLLRADSLHRLTAAEVDALIAEGVTTIVDLRNAKETVEAPSPFRGHDAVTFVNISLFENLTSAASIAERESADGDPLYGLYIEALAECRPAIRDVLTAIAKAGDGAVLFHCTAGKDRTGIIAALLLALAEVEEAHILQDYALTERMIAPIVEELMTSAAARGIAPETFRRLLGSDPKTMLKTLEHINERYGSVLDYCALIGLDSGTVAALTERLVGNAPAPRDARHG